MSRWLLRAGALAAVACTSTVVATAALAFLHRELQPARALACAVVAVGGALAVRGAWRRLPPFVADWLDVGVALSISLLGAVVTMTMYDLPYAVLRWPEATVVGCTAGLTSAAVASLAYTHHRLADEVVAQAQQVALLEQRALESRLSALSAQINPHFLFNTLNTVAQMVHEDADVAEDLITDLAAMMRYALRSSTTWVPLSDEIAMVERLLRVAQARLGDRLQTTVELDDDVSHLQVPGLLVQPLVENAIQHGVSKRPEGGRIEVRASRHGSSVRIEVLDDGPGLPPDVSGCLTASGRGTAGAGGGLNNAAERTRLSWPDGSARLWVDPDAAGTRLVLDLPLSPEP
ncbi:MAG: histidine kinase [Myxococcales bacterium]|nr:histidine kinase [Myxococcales bacterium]